MADQVAELLQQLGPVDLTVEDWLKWLRKVKR
jgi:hypothetical protein